MDRIKYIHAREILDSRGNPTVEVEVVNRKWCGGDRIGAFRRFDRRIRGT